MTVTVAIPYWRCPDLIERAVRSVLAQTHRDLVCLVIGDGEDPPLAGISDPRLEVYRLPENRGAYFVQEVALQATPHDWYAPVGADDWIEPDHLARLLAIAERTDAVATGVVWWHDGDAAPREHRGTYEVGLFAPRRLLELGGHNPTERMGQDTLMIRLLRLGGQLRYSSHPTYHRVKRPGALTTDPATGFGSIARNEMRRRNRRVFAQCQQLRTPARIARYRRSLVSAAVWAEVAGHAAALALQLGRVAA